MPYKPHPIAMSCRRIKWDLCTVRGMWQMLNKHWRAGVREMEKGQEGDNLSHLAVSVFLSRSPGVMSSLEARQCCSLHGPALPAPSLPLCPHQPGHQSYWEGPCPPATTEPQLISPSLQFGSLDSLPWGQLLPRPGYVFIPHHPCQPSALGFSCLQQHPSPLPPLWFIKCLSLTAPRG